MWSQKQGLNFCNYTISASVVYSHTKILFLHFVAQKDQFFTFYSIRTYVLVYMFVYTVYQFVFAFQTPQAHKKSQTPIASYIVMLVYRHFLTLVITWQYSYVHSYIHVIAKTFKIHLSPCT